jgi:hypothetical protein
MVNLALKQKINMGVGTVIIDKVSEDKGVGYYAISSTDFDVKTFYMSINGHDKIIKFYSTSDFSQEPIRTIDYNKNPQIGMIPEVPMRVFTIAVSRAIKTFKMDHFPESLTYEA